MAYRTSLYLALGTVVGAAGADIARAQQADFHAIVEPGGEVVLCVSSGDILFPDQCAGSGELMIVQPIQEGPITWRSASGNVALENQSPQNRDCALSRAKWDKRTERTAVSGKTVRKVDPAMVLARLDEKHTPRYADLLEVDIEAFALDLDNDGSEEIVFSASNVRRLVELHEKSQQTYPYVVMGGIVAKTSRLPTLFYFESGEYSGGTDTIGRLSIKGVTPIAARTGEISLLVATGRGVAGDQMLVRYRSGNVQRLETFEFRCN
jgi:hypothetical protein